VYALRQKYNESPQTQAIMIPELDYLEKLIVYRLDQCFPTSKESVEPVIPPFNEWRLPLGAFAAENELTDRQALLLLVALVPHLQPDFFDKVIEGKLSRSGDFPRIGGVRGKNSRSFLPTGQTAVFLLAGDDLETRFEVQKYFGAEHFFSVKKIAWLEELPTGEPWLSGRIILSHDYGEIFTTGEPAAPHFSMSFPAKRIREKRDWSALVINDELRNQISEIITWLQHNETLMTQWRMHDRLKKGFRALFHGPPGTGKTLTAGLLGNALNRDVYKIDLSMVVSKYIGETEKNLELLFSRAEDKGWILFFDEADALFGKRTSVRDAHDKYANQEVSYLLQRIEEYNGLIILATNMRNNIDDAFMRRFNAVLKFSFPDASERSLIWTKAFPWPCLFARDVDELPEPADALFSIPDVVKKYELSGGSIINAVHYASLKAVERFQKKQRQTPLANEKPKQTSQLVIALADVVQGIKKELTKEGRPFPG